MQARLMPEMPSAAADWVLLRAACEREQVRLATLMLRADAVYRTLAGRHGYLLAIPSTVPRSSQPSSRAMRARVCGCSAAMPRF